MEYQRGNLGRVFMIRFDHEEDILENLKDLVKKENVRTGWFQLLGGMRSGEVVTGPEAPTVPPVPVIQNIDQAQEVIATGSILWNDEDPVLHVHGGMGSKAGAMIGCLRKDLKVYLLIEAVVFEFTNMNIKRNWYPEGEFNRMEFEEQE